jgi:hypothetical protein
MSQDSEHITNGSLDEDRIMIYTHNIRKRIVSGMTENGSVPKDTREIQALAGVLNDMDRAAISVKKIKSDEKVADVAASGGAALVAKLLTQLNPAAFRSDKFVDIVPPELGSEISRPELKPGETDLGTSSLTFDEFSKVHFKSNE